MRSVGSADWIVGTLLDGGVVGRVWSGGDESDAIMVNMIIMRGGNDT